MMPLGSMERIMRFTLISNAVRNGRDDMPAWRGRAHEWM